MEYKLINIIYIINILYYHDGYYEFSTIINMYDNVCSQYWILVLFMEYLNLIQFYYQS